MGYGYDDTIADLFGRYARSFYDTERGTSMYKLFLDTLVATSGNAFAGDIAVKSRDAIKLHQEKYNANSVIPQVNNKTTGSTL